MRNLLYKLLFKFSSVRKGKIREFQGTTNDRILLKYEQQLFQENNNKMSSFFWG